MGVTLEDDACYVFSENNVLLIGRNTADCTLVLLVPPLAVFLNLIHA